MNILIMILLVSLLILVHELGHFMAARMCGVKVARFGFGMPFGPELKLFKWGDTEFYLHAFLLGGYVSFEDDVVDKEDENYDEKAPYLYENKTIAQKLFIVSAGVLMNILFAIFLVISSAIFFQKLPTPNQNIYVNGFIEKPNSNIQIFDIKKGDKFEKINGNKIENLYQLVFYTKNSKLFDDYAQKDLYEKNLEQLKKLNPKLNETILKDTKVLLPKAKPENTLTVNQDVLKGLEKYKKDGIKLNENQIKLRNEIYSKSEIVLKEETSLSDLALALSDTYKPMEMVFLRGEKEINITVKVGKDGLLGTLLIVEDIFCETKTAKDIVVKSFDYLYSTTSTMLYSLWQLFAGKVNASDMHGVIAIVKVGGDIIAQKGMLNGILLTAMISINLAIMNFLPIPALDGGHIAFLIFEKITGRKPSQKAIEKINNFFFILLITLMLLICYNDVMALVTKKF
ncbi:MAG: RIP metalloprotease RseP [Candidatus Gastranaerophilales bacterium]|nr:RIP metalloprotease RseP [Candidatus Gastranaerophilales bacterium]